MNKIENDLNISRNVSPNKMIHAILALVFFDKVFQKGILSIQQVAI